MRTKHERKCICGIRTHYTYAKVGEIKPVCKNCFLNEGKLVELR